MAAVFCVPEDVWMAAFHLVADAIDYVLEREMAGLLGHLRVEDDLKLEIAELVGKRRHVVAGNGVRDLIGFLDRIGGDGGERLDGIPFAAAYGIAQPTHDFAEAYKRHGGPLRIYNLQV